MPKPSAKGAASVAALVTSVLPMQEIGKLSIKEACQRFAERATIAQRAFAEMGKLHYAISTHLRKGQTIYGELRKLGVKDSTISNASYAARVWGDLIAQGHLAEADFDTFTFADCLAICRVSGDKSKRKLAGEEVAVIVKAHPADFDSQLGSLFETGLTVEEAEAQAKAAQEAAARAEQERKAAAERAAAERVEAEKQAAIAAALEAERQRQAAAAAAAVAAVAATPPPVSAGPDAAVEDDADADDDSSAPAAEVSALIAPTVPTAPVAPAPVAEVPVETPKLTVMPPPVAAPAPAPVETPSAKSNVVAMPELPADPDAALPSVLATLDDVLATAEGMGHDARAQVFAKLNAMMGQLSQRLSAETTAAA